MTREEATQINKIVQIELSAARLYSGQIDGIPGPRTFEGVTKHPLYNADWEYPRNLVKIAQVSMNESGFNAGTPDGYYGPQTDHALDLWVNYYYQDKQVLFPDRTKEYPSGNTTSKWPYSTQSALEKYYGKIEDVPGELTKLELPYLHKLSWAQDSVVKTISCHKLVKDSLGRILQNVLECYGEEEIKRLGLDLFGGCYNKRKKRGGDTWSTHSWACALDYDPMRNRLRWGADKAEFAKEDYKDWWGFWQEEGWISLGILKNYDWMHIQAAHLD